MSNGNRCKHGVVHDGFSMCEVCWAKACKVAKELKEEEEKLKELAK